MMKLSVRPTIASLRSLLLLTCLTASYSALGPTNVASAQEAQEYLLRYKFNPDQVLRYAVVHKANVDTSIGGSTQKADMSTKSVKRWQVQTVEENGNASFEHQIESIDMSQTVSGRREIRYNSETDSEVPHDYAEAAKAVGIPLSVVTVDARGQIINREQKHNQPGATNDSQVLYPLPEAAVAVGQSWTVPFSALVKLENGGNKQIRCRQHFELKGVSPEGIATIALETQVLDVIDNPKLEVQLIQRLTQGQIQFDIEQGRILHQSLDLDRRIVGFSGPSSSIHMIGSFSEQLLEDAEPKTAQAGETNPASSSSKK